MKFTLKYDIDISDIDFDEMINKFKNGSDLETIIVEYMQEHGYSIKYDCIDEIRREIYKRIGGVQPDNLTIQDVIQYFRKNKVWKNELKDNYSNIQVRNTNSYNLIAITCKTYGEFVDIAIVSKVNDDFAIVEKYNYTTFDPILGVNADIKTGIMETNILSKLTEIDMPIKSIEYLCKIMNHTTYY